jgi:hypothetical protein
MSFHHHRPNFSVMHIYASLGYFTRLRHQNLLRTVRYTLTTPFEVDPYLISTFNVARSPWIILQDWRGRVVLSFFLYCFHLEFSNCKLGSNRQTHRLARQLTPDVFSVSIICPFIGLAETLPDPSHSHSHQQTHKKLFGTCTSLYQLVPACTSRKSS